MDGLGNVLQDIFQLLLAADSELIEIIRLSLQVSFTAVIIGILLGIPFGTLMGLYNFPGRQIIVVLNYTMMGLPPVLVGVLVYLLLSAKGPMGAFELLFTPTAMVVAQVCLVTPIISGLTMVAVRGKVKQFWESAISLGATQLQAAWLVIKEAKLGIIAAVITAFGRAISEVGAVMLVGGNIEHSTRVMTTAIILETRKGNFVLGLGLGLVLLIISFIINGLMTFATLRVAQRGDEN